MPPAYPGMTIGLFGGSFNPPHRGHAHVAEIALERLGLDRVWVMVTPGNPLKERQGLPSLDRRIAATRATMPDPRIVVTGFEAALGSAYSWATVRHLTRTRPGVRFVWVMGADNLGTFHRWQNWRRIVDAVPIAIVDRPGSTLAALSSRAAATMVRHRVPEAEASALAGRAPPAWVFLHAPRVPLSSTGLRAAGRGLAD
ncbi:nicotinate-nucleotide adenylyltransferase [Prosthecomicrobium sp. N25]